MITRSILIVLVIIILIGAGYWLIDTASAPTPQDIPQDSSSLRVGSNAILVDDQVPSGSVTISMAVLQNDGWIVIHDERDGKPGFIIAAARLNAGNYKNRQVDLLGKQMEEGKSYYAMIHRDDGDRVFDYTKDLPADDPLGNPVTMRFVATVNAQQGHASDVTL